MGLMGSGWIAPLVLWLGICIHALLEGMSMGLQVGLSCWLNPNCTVSSQSAGGHALLHRPRLLAKAAHHVTSMCMLLKCIAVVLLLLNTLANSVV